MFVFIISYKIGENMQSISQINAYRYYQFKKFPNSNIKRSVHNSSYCSSPQSVVFTGNYEAIKDGIINKYLTFKLKKVLQEVDLISQNLDKNNLGTKDEILNAKCKNLLNYIARKTKTTLVYPPIEYNFDKIKNLTIKQGINLSSEQKTELFKRFNLSKNRKKLMNKTVETLEFLKNSNLFESHSNVIQSTIVKMDRAIRCFGLSKEVKNIVIKSEDNLNVKLNIPDSLDLAENIYGWLVQHRKSGHVLPKEILFNDFDFFTNHNSGLSASYVSGVKSNDYDEIISKYPSLTNKFSKKQIYFNPIFLISREGKNDSDSVIEDLEHELGHFWHNLKIGDEAFHSKRMNSIDGFLSIKDNNFLLDLKNKISGKVCFTPSINLTGKITEDLSEIIPDIQNMIKHRHDLGIEHIITEKVISKFNQIIQKLEVLTSITSKNFSNCPDELLYAFTSPKELVAFAIQKRHDHEYDAEFIKILKRLGMPEIKD